MQSMMQRREFLVWGGSAAALAVAGLSGCGGGGDLDGQTVVPALPISNRYRQTNLVATSAAYGAPLVLPEMVDAWGIAIRPAGAGGHFWVTGGGTSWQFVGDVTASSDPQLQTLFQDGLAKVTLAGADALNTVDSLGKATGTAFNGAPLTSPNYRVTQQLADANGTSVRFDGSARFVFVTDSGSLSAWTDRAADGATVRVDGPAQLVFDGREQGMSFFGVALKTDTWDRLWVVDFGAVPQIRQFDPSWQLVPTQGFANPFATGPLLDANNPTQGNAAKPGEPVPFNMQVIGNRVLVAYCISQVLRDDAGLIVDASKIYPSEEDALAADDEARSGGQPNRGKLVEYTLTGALVRIFDDAGRLNAPWGIALAPADFGLLSGALLVGNFGGAGKIAGFELATGRFIDYLRDEAGAVVGIAGLWALMFGNGASLGDSNALYFAAGPEDEAAGLFGSLRVAA